MISSDWLYTYIDLKFYIWYIFSKRKVNLNFKFEKLNKKVELKRFMDYLVHFGTAEFSMVKIGQLVGARSVIS